MTTINIDCPSRVAQGQQFKATIAVDSITNFDAANYDVDFDPAVFQVVDVSDGLIGSTAVPVDMWRDLGSGKLRIINNVPGLPGLSGTGYLAAITFNAIAFKKTTAINLSNGVLSDNQANEIEATWSGKDLAIFVAGDVDGDGSVDLSDIAALEKMIVELEPATSDGDVNTDGDINCLDITSIKQIIAGKG